LLSSAVEVVLPEAEKSRDFFLASLSVRFVKEGKFAGRHIIPVTLKGKLVAYEVRSFNGQFLPKVLVMPPNVKIHSYLWNFDNVLPGLPIIVVEGIKAAIAVLSFGYPNVVSSFGAQLSSDQVALLISKFPSEVIIAYDADSSGFLGADKAIGSLLAWTEVSKVKLPDGADPWDVPKPVWDECLENRKRVLVVDRNREVIKSLRSSFFS
jgi:DNA primase